MMWDKNDPKHINNAGFISCIQPPGGDTHTFVELHLYVQFLNSESAAGLTLLPPALLFSSRPLSRTWLSIEPPWLLALDSAFCSSALASCSSSSCSLRRPQVVTGRLSPSEPELHEPETQTCTGFFNRHRNQLIEI